MKVDTRKSNIQVVIIRLLGELAAKAGAVDLPLKAVSMGIEVSTAKAYLTSSTLTHAGLAVR